MLGWYSDNLARPFRAGEIKGLSIKAGLVYCLIRSSQPFLRFNHLKQNEVRTGAFNTQGFVCLLTRKPLMLGDDSQAPKAF